MPRHRGTYNPENKEAYELSRSRIENFIKCPACFYLMQVKGIKFPSIPGFNINEATDVLLKRDFDKFRGAERTHQFLINLDMGHLIPFDHPNFELWTQSLHFGAEGRMNFIHEASNLKVGGGLDDVWFNKDTEELHIVDYKSTSQKTAGKEISLDDPWKEAYKRQMDLYVWVMMQKGFNVSSTGYFLYCDGDRFSDYNFLNQNDASMIFKMSLLPYDVNLDWIEPTLMSIRECLHKTKCPPHDTNCEYGQFLNAVGV